MTNVRINLLAPELRRDPFPTYRRLQEQAAACQVDPGGMWVVTRYAEVTAALHDPATYSSRGFRAALAPAWLKDERLASMLIALDPPEHTGLRGLVSRLFGRALLDRVEQPLRSLASSLCTAAAQRGECEVVGELATPIAAAAVATLLGVDAGEHRRFKHWVDAIGSITPVEPDARRAKTIRDAIEDEDVYLRALIEERRARPGDDLVSQLLQSELDGRPLPMDQVVSLAALLLGAGIDTTIHLLSKSLLLLSERADLLTRLRREPSLVPNFIEELLRFDPPTHALLRLTTRDVQLDDVTIPANASVLLLLAAANRDPRHFEQPDTFEIERKVRGTMAFGHGVHLCVGAALARFEARITLEIALACFESFERDSATPIVWDSALHTRGPLSLRMRFTGKSERFRG